MSKQYNYERDLLSDDEQKNTNYLDKLEENYKKLVSYKNNLFKLDALILLEKDQQTKEEFITMKSDLIQAIQYQGEQIKQQQKSNEYLYSIERINKDYLQCLCKAYDKKSQQWINGYIVEVDVEKQIAKVYLIEQKREKQLEGIFVKVIQKNEKEEFKVGSYVEAIYSKDGLFHAAQIESIIDDQHHLHPIPSYIGVQTIYLIKFQRWNTIEYVPLSYLRESQSQINKTQKLPWHQKTTTKFSNLDTFKPPDHLKILPNDSEQQRIIKKKKIKNLKFQFKQARLEKDTSEKTNVWKQFVNKTQPNGISKKYGHFQYKQQKDSIFKDDLIEQLKQESLAKNYQNQRQRYTFQQLQDEN